MKQWNILSLSLSLYIYIYLKNWNHSCFRDTKYPVKAIISIFPRLQHCIQYPELQTLLHLLCRAELGQFWSKSTGNVWPFMLIFLSCRIFFLLDKWARSNIYLQLFPIIWEQETSWKQGYILISYIVISSLVFKNQLLCNGLLFIYHISKRPPYLVHRNMY